MAILVVGEHRSKQEWEKEFFQFDDTLKIYHYSEKNIPYNDVEFAITWNHPIGYFNQFPNLKVIASLGAGVDHIFRDKNIPRQVKVTRIVDQKLTNDMSDFVLLSCLNYARNTQTYFNNQKKSLWSPVPYRSVNQLTVGVMGFGELGEAVAMRLKGIGFNIKALSKTSKPHPIINVFSADSMDEFLKELNILVCLLPLTDATRGILSKTLFTKIQNPFFLINVARGAHLNEDDFLYALKKGTIEAAHLDVFDYEPLPEDHIFWTLPNVTITPHIASKTSPASVTQQLYENYQRMMANKKLLNEVNKVKEY